MAVEFLGYFTALGNRPPLRGDNVVIITNGGGAGLLAADHFERLGHAFKGAQGYLTRNLREYQKLHACIRFASTLLISVEQQPLICMVVHLNGI